MICHINQPTDFLQVGCDRVGKTTWRTANGWNISTRREGSLHIRGIQAAYRAHPERTRRGKSDGSVTRPTGSLLALLLEETHLSGPVREAIGEFIAARRFAGRRIVVSHWGGIR